MAGNGSQGNKESPLFYKNPVPLQAERHSDYYLNTHAGLGFAANTNAVPINASEFMAVGRHYPIVFAGDKDVTPLAVLGLRESENLLLDDQGRWRDGLYVPAYIRRYPFIFMTDEVADKFTLCLDEDAEAVSQNGEGEPLFVSGEPSVMAKQALDFCTAFQREATATKLLASAVKGQDLLIPSTVNLHRDDLGDLSLGGIQVVDENKFNQLDNEIFLEWREKKILALVYIHLFSMGNWEQLAKRIPVVS